MNFKTDGVSDEVIAQSKAFDTSAELIHDETFMYEDIHEVKPVAVFHITSNDTIITIPLAGGETRLFKLTESFVNIARNYRDEILEYSLSSYTDEDIVCMNDIFMQGKYIIEVK